jgi:hypothetical protein
MVVSSRYALIKEEKDSGLGYEGAHTEVYDDHPPAV